MIECYAVIKIDFFKVIQLIMILLIFNNMGVFNIQNVFLRIFYKTYL